MTLGYVQPGLYTTGQILGRANLDILRDNDDYFDGLANRWRPVPCGCVRTWIGTETSGISAWDGYHYLESDATLLNYSMTVTADAPAYWQKCQLYYDYDGDNETLIATADTDEGTTGSITVSGTYDLSGFSPGLYRIYAAMTREDGGSGGSFYVAAPYTTYTGSLSYSTPSYEVVDGFTSSVAHFNTWRGNDRYFYACRPRQPAFSGMSMTTAPGTQTVDLFNGWMCHRNTRFYYGTTLTPEDGETNVDANRIQFLYGGDSHASIGTVGDASSYFDLSDSYTYTIGTWYRVRVRIWRTTSTLSCTGTLKYLYSAPPQELTPFEPDFLAMNDFTVGQYVKGNTTSNFTRLELLSDNDRSIYPRLCWNATVGRRDYAVRTPTYVRLAGTDYGDFYLLRRGDTLTYRGAGMTMEWGSGSSQSLDNVTTGYGTFDLNGLEDLPHGTIYHITGNSKAYAMEL